MKRGLSCNWFSSSLLGIRSYVPFGFVPETRDFLACKLGCAVNVYVIDVPKSSADVSNTAVRIFLHEIGRSYDEERGLQPCKKKDFPEVKKFFNNTCCYCGIRESEARLTGDHLVPTNRKSLGLEAWGNIVPACAKCNEEKHFNDWREFMENLSDTNVRARRQRIEEFIAHYGYEPDLETIKLAVVELYEESGGIVDTLVKLKLERALQRIAAKSSS